MATLHVCDLCGAEVKDNDEQEICFVDMFEKPFENVRMRVTIEKMIPNDPEEDSEHNWMREVKPHFADSDFHVCDKCIKENMAYVAKHYDSLKEEEWDGE